MASLPLHEITFDPVQGHNHTHTAVFLHGRGDNAANFTDALARSRDSQGRTLRDAFPSFRWVFPEAPLRKVASAAGLEVHQWFDTWNTKDFSENEGIQIEGLKDSIPKIRGILAREVATLGGRWDKVILMGISMGSATSVHTLFNLEVPAPYKGLAAYIGFSGRCPFAGQTLEQMRATVGLGETPSNSSVLQNTPILLEHCSNDPLVKVDWGKKQYFILKDFGANPEWREYPSGGHWFNAPQGMDDVVTFLKAVL